MGSEMCIRDRGEEGLEEEEKKEEKGEEEQEKEEEEEQEEEEEVEQGNVLGFTSLTSNKEFTLAALVFYFLPIKSPSSQERISFRWITLWIWEVSVITIVKVALNTLSVKREDQNRSPTVNARCSEVRKELSTKLSDCCFLS